MNVTLGAGCRHLWRLDPDFLTVNHGSFGATPVSILDEQQRWRDRLERQPSRFMRTELPDALRAAAERLGQFVGASGKDIVFVDNATSGCNAVLRSLELSPGDDVLVLSHGYGAVRNTARFVTERCGARVAEAVIPFPDTKSEAVIDAIGRAITSRTRIAIIDHITSASALVLPVTEIIGVCHARGVPVLIDGAHAPAHVGLDLSNLGADWYTGNCHKWLCAPKGAAFLWAAPDRQVGLNPTVISHGFGQGYLPEFDWTGTRDPTASLSVPAAIEFHEHLGGHALRQRNIALAAEAAALIAGRLNSSHGTSGGLAGAMRLVEIPVSPNLDLSRLRDRLIAEGTDVPVHAVAGTVWLRLSAFAYNDIDDYSRLGDMIARVVGEHAS